MAFVVIYDACVLYPAPLRDLLLRLAAKGLVRARWTDQILDECFRSILLNRPDLNEAALHRQSLEPSAERRLNRLARDARRSTRRAQGAPGPRGRRPQHPSRGGRGGAPIRHELRADPLFAFPQPRRARRPSGRAHRSRSPVRGGRCPGRSSRARTAEAASMAEHNLKCSSTGGPRSTSTPTIPRTSAPASPTISARPARRCPWGPRLANALRGDLRGAACAHGPVTRHTDAPRAAISWSRVHRGMPSRPSAPATSIPNVIGTTISSSPVRARATRSVARGNACIRADRRDCDEAHVDHGDHNSVSGRGHATGAGGEFPRDGGRRSFHARGAGGECSRGAQSGRNR
jgi:hypothetical protein